MWNLPLTGTRMHSIATSRQPEETNRRSMPKCGQQIAADDDGSDVPKNSLTSQRQLPQPLTPHDGSLSRQLSLLCSMLMASVSDSPKALFADHQAACGATHFAVKVYVVQGIAPGDVARVVLFVELDLQVDQELAKVEYL